jgi:hypothetical protein
MSDVATTLIYFGSAQTSYKLAWGVNLEIDIE